MNHITERKELIMPGTTDGAPPEYYSDEQLSRVKDALDACSHVDTYCNATTRAAMWKVLPPALKIDFNYSKWDYVAKGKTTVSKSSK